MGKLIVRHLIEKPSGFYFQPSATMRRAGFHPEPLGKDRGAATARADALNAEWDAIRAGAVEAAAPKAPPGTFARVAEDFLASAAYLDWAQATQEEIEYALGIILPVFGQSPVKAIKPNHVEKFYDGLRKSGSVHRAQRAMKWLRFLLNRAVALQLVQANPARTVRVKHPKPRATVWTSPHEVRRAIATAWKDGNRAVAVALALGYDTGLRPVDIRRLTWGDVEDDRVRIVQAKTGRPTHLPLWSSTVRLLGLYKSKLGAVPLASATVLRTRRGKPYTKDRLTRDVRAVLRKAGIPDELRLSDLRRTASKERAEAGASEAELAAGGGWSIERGAAILDVYNPRTYEMAASAQAKRRNKTRPKV